MFPGCLRLSGIHAQTPYMGNGDAIAMLVRARLITRIKRGIHEVAPQKCERLRKGPGGFGTVGSDSR